MQERLRKIERKLVKIGKYIEDFPPGRLIYSKTGKYIKWYQQHDKKKTYISKKDKHMAEKLALKKYYQLIKNDLSIEKDAILSYLNIIDSHKETAEQFLIKNSEFQNLLKTQFTPRSKELETWMNASYNKNPYYPEKLIHKSISGNIVRSKSEAIIDMLLYTHKIPYRYDCELILDQKIIYPDFTIMHPQTGQIFYWEHCGLVERAKYMEDMLSKLRTYILNGIIPTIHLILTFETIEEPFTGDAAEKIIEQYFLP